MRRIQEICVLLYLSTVMKPTFFRSSPGRLSNTDFIVFATLATIPERTAEEVTSMTKKNTVGMGPRTWAHTHSHSCLQEERSSYQAYRAAHCKKMQRILKQCARPGVLLITVQYAARTFKLTQDLGP